MMKILNILECAGRFETKECGQYDARMSCTVHLTFFPRFPGGPGGPGGPEKQKESC